jgi:hypothetical protein
MIERDMDDSSLGVVSASAIQVFEVECELVSERAVVNRARFETIVIIWFELVIKRSEDVIA